MITTRAQLPPRPGAPRRGGRQAPDEPLSVDGVAVFGELSLSPGEKLYGEGEPAAAPFLVVEGVLRVTVDAHGRSRLVDLVGRGDVVGTAALEGRPHAESVHAAERGAVVAVVDLATTLEHRGPRQALVAALVRQMVRSRQLADDLGLPMGARICRILARLAERLGEPVEGAPGSPAAGRWRHLPFSLTHDDVALMAGCARVTATRVLGDLKEAGVLGGTRGDYALVPEALEEAADRYVWEVI
ncbi:MAG TPA: Crp/Fnr family transcriptional regulator [Trueperaceae bacterium]